YRGWRQRHRQRPAQVARADRLAGGKVSLDDPLEDLARTLVQLAQSGRRFRCGLGFVDVRMAHCGANLGASPTTRQTRAWLTWANSGTTADASSSGAPKWAK